MRSACFDYLALGGIYSSGPVSLLSGLNPRPSVLVMHFFMVRAEGGGRGPHPCFTRAAGSKQRRSVACLSALARVHACARTQVALYGVGRLLLPRPTFRGLWLGILVLIMASRIIFPIIASEGIRAVFLPWLASKPHVAAARLRQPAQHTCPASGQ